jgi:hypothetical protein
MELYDRDAAKYHRKALERGADPTKQAGISYRYECSVGELKDFVLTVKCSLNRLGLPIYVFNAAVNYAKQIYGFKRKYPRDMMMTAAAQVAVPWMACGLTVDHLVKVAEASFSALNLGVLAVAGAQLREMIELEAARMKDEGGRMKDMEKDEVNVQDANCVSHDGEETKNETTMNEGTTPVETALVLKPSELAAKVQEFLATKLENPGDAEPMAKDIAEAVVQGSKPDATPARRKPQRRGKPAPSELSETGVTGQPTPLERFTKRGATAALRAALTGHQDVVKFVVAGRLCAKKTFDELAQEFGLTKDEVLDIMTRMRAWVTRFTTYFDNEWYWKEGMGKYFIPAPPQIVPGGAK